MLVLPQSAGPEMKMSLQWLSAVSFLPRMPPYTLVSLRTYLMTCSSARLPVTESICGYRTDASPGSWMVRRRRVIRVDLRKSMYTWACSLPVLGHRSTPTRTRCVFPGCRRYSTSSRTISSSCSSVCTRSGNRVSSQVFR